MNGFTATSSHTGDGRSFVVDAQAQPGGSRLIACIPEASAVAPDERGNGYEHLLRTVAAGDGDRSLSTPLTRYHTEGSTP
jgi:hypothetical protein